MLSAKPLKVEAILIFSSINAFVFSFVENQIGISFGIFSLYALLSFLDVFLGIYFNVIINKNSFKSELFLKKIFVFSLAMASLFGANEMAEYAGKFKVPNLMIEHFQGVVVYSFVLMKLFLVVAYLTYEITSVRENLIKLKWKSAVDIIDILLLPITSIKSKLQNKIKE